MRDLEPAILTIFGITGDLAKRKLLPALYHLAHDKLLPDSFRIVGISRRGTTVNDVLKIIEVSISSSGKSCDKTTLAWLKKVITIVDMDITIPEQYSKLKHELDIIEDSTGICLNRLFYLAIPSTLFGAVTDRLGKEDLNNGCQHGVTESRLLIEKPFGYDLASAKELITTLKDSFTEKQIYRIDHYLAKETVQNILTFRFENPLFSTSWDKTHISHIMITASEEIGIEGRVTFYDQIGALRDLIQSHLLQILALVTMDRPKNMDAINIHKAKEAILKKVLPPAADMTSEETVRGQYDSYKQEVGNKHSTTETFAAVRLYIDEPRWQGVPMFIRTGKALAEKVTEITVAFKDSKAPECLNYLTIRIQPNEGIVLNLRIKKPGFNQQVEDVQMDFCYNEKLGVSHPDAYERVLVDVMRGDKTLFATSNEVLASWEIIEPILYAWQSDRQPLYIYKNNSWGPEEPANNLLKEVSGEWLTDILHVCNVHLPELTTIKHK